MEEIQNSKQWNDFLLAQPTQATATAGQAGVFLQSWEWGEFQQAMGRKVYRYQSGDMFAQAIELSLPFEKKYWFIPRGSLIPGISDEARKHSALFIRCEPVQSDAPTGAMKTKSINPAQTLIVDLSKSEDELLAGMHEKTRYNIRLAERKGVKCQMSNVKCFNEFWKMMEETANRDKFRTHPREYYEKMLEICCPERAAGKSSALSVKKPSFEEPLNDGGFFVKLYMAYHNTTPIACAMVGYFGDTATYLHGASSYEYRSLMGTYALHWQIIQNAKKQGYKYYDFWGIDEKKWPGITRFKMGFNGKVVNYPGAFDLPLNEFWYTVYRLGRCLLP